MIISNTIAYYSFWTIMTLCKHRVHITTGENVCCFGSRTPAIFARSSNPGLNVHSAISGDENKHFSSPSPTIGLYTTIEIRQEMNEEGEMIFTVVIDGVEVHQMENTDPRVFENVAVFVGNPWTSANEPNYILGYVMDLSIYVKIEPKKISHGTSIRGPLRLNECSLNVVSNF